MRVWPVLRDVLARGAGTPRAAGAAAQARRVARRRRKPARRRPRRQGRRRRRRRPRRRLAEARQRRPRAGARRRAPPGAGPARAERPRRCRRTARARTAAGGRTSTRTCGRCSRGPSQGTYATHFCGGGDVARCAASLWAAIDEAAAELAAAQGADPSAWRADATKERIVFAPGILTRTMRGSNKPTFQQAITFATHR